jgi:hypothetical protein
MCINVKFADTGGSGGLRRESETARFLGLRVRIPTWTLMFVTSECCAWLLTGLHVGPIPLPEESYQAWCI